MLSCITTELFKGICCLLWLRPSSQYDAANIVLWASMWSRNRTEFYSSGVSIAFLASNSNQSYCHILWRQEYYLTRTFPAMLMALMTLMVPGSCCALDPTSKLMECSASGPSQLSWSGVKCSHTCTYSSVKFCPSLALIKMMLAIINCDN